MVDPIFSYEHDISCLSSGRLVIFVMFAGPDGRPNPATTVEFAIGVFPVDMTIGPDGNLYYVDIVFEEIHRISYVGSNTPPIAV